MHISDGVLSEPVWISGYAAAAVITTGALIRIKEKDIPKVAVVASFFFVASLFPLKLGPTSVHLVLNGLAGVLLGLQAFPCIFVGLFLQAALFGHGGLTSLGANAVIMGVPALGAFLIFSLHRRKPFRFRGSPQLFGALAGGAGILGSALLLALALMTTGEAFYKTAYLAAAVHLPIAGIEALITCFAVSFLQKVKPEILENR